MNIINKIKNNCRKEIPETARKESNGQSKTALFKKVTGEAIIGPVFILKDYELREESVICTMEMIRDQSAVKKEKRGKKVSVWV